MKKFVICFLLIFTLTVIPLLFVGCNKDTSGASEISNNPNDETSIVTAREFRFEKQNNFENINYDFDNNKITLNLSTEETLNVVSFSVKIYNDNKLSQDQSILYEISNSNEIEVVNFAFTNFYLKFNKAGTYSLKIFDEFEYLTKTILIVVV